MMAAESDKLLKAAAVSTRTTDNSMESRLHSLQCRDFTLQKISSTFVVLFLLLLLLRQLFVLGKLVWFSIFYTV